MRSIIIGGTVGVVAALSLAIVAGSIFFATFTQLKTLVRGEPQPVSQECIITVPAEEWAQGDGRYRVNL